MNIPTWGLARPLPQIDVGVWPKFHLLRHPETMVLEERIATYQWNIRCIRASGRPVPSALADTLDPVEIAQWFVVGEQRLARLRGAIQGADALLAEEKEREARTQENQRVGGRCSMKRPSTERVRVCRAVAAAMGRKPVQVTVAERDRTAVKMVAKLLNGGGEGRHRLYRQLAILAAEVLPKQKRALGGAA